MIMLKFLNRAKPKGKLNRRQFLSVAAAAGGGLAIGFRPLAVLAEGDSPLNPLDVYIKIGKDSVVTVLSAHMDKGQGIYTGLATLVAEELDADWSQMRTVGATGNSKAYGNIAYGGTLQATGSSTSIFSSWTRYRQAGATARAMLIEAAAKAWSVSPQDVKVEKGMISAGSKSEPFGTFAEAAAAMPVPANVTLKEPKDWRLIGTTEAKRVDTAEKISGAPIYTIDVDLPNLLTAVISRPPKFGAFVKSVDDTEAKKVAGVTDVVNIGYAVAVVAEGMWPAIKAKRLLKIEWDFSKAETRSSSEIFDEFKKIAGEKPTVVATSKGEVEGAFASAETVVEATYEFPYLAHATMEPMNCVVAKTGEVIETWTAHQSSDGDTYAIAGVTGAKPENIRTHMLYGGGSFGRRTNFQSDFVVDALLIAKSINYRQPVKLQWLREDDMSGGYYRPMVVHKLRAGLDRSGEIVAWDQYRQSL
jgi:isoquinoline 1-oxidoreductase subunit beta